MAKKKNKQSSGGADEATTKREEPLQAVLLADSFLHSFRPLSLDRPKVLCPLNNVTLIDYAMDFLAGAGVEEVFVVCVSDAVERHVLERQAWATKMQVTVVKDAFFTNAGDALRELDKRGSVKSDPFILMFGDCVTNVNLSDALRAHKERHKKDASAMMTLLMKRVGKSHLDHGRLMHSAIRSNHDDLVVGLDPSQENRILVFDNHSDRTNVSIPCSFLAAHAQMEVHTDLLDCGIDICSPDVLVRFSDEFDYRDIRHEFVANSVAEEEEGLQNKIFAHILKSTEYAARVYDLATYHAISQDLLRRWCYPVVPDNLPSGYEKQYRYALQRRSMYHEQKNLKSRIGRSSKVQGPGMIGASCSIGEDCRIQATVIGNQCEIASKVTLQESHLWDNVCVEQGATVVHSILANGCVIKAGAVVSRGCCVGAGCVVGANVVLPEFTRLTMAKESGDDDFDDEWSDSGDENEAEESMKEGDVVVSDKNIVGADGKGRVWKPPSEDEDDDEDEEVGPSAEEMLKVQSIGFAPSEFFRLRQITQKEEEDDFSVEANMDENMTDGDYSEGAVTFDAPTTTPSMFGRPKGVDAVNELKTICLEFESGPIENLAIELNSFKFSRNASYSDCTMAATLAILEKLEITKDTKDGKLVGDFKAMLGRWGVLLRKMSQGVEEEEAIIRALESAATSGGEMGEKLSSGMTFRFLLQTMFDEEIVSEEAVLAWATKRKEEPDDSSRAKLFQSKPIQDFLEWLEEESEEEGDTDDEDDSE